MEKITAIEKEVNAILKTEYVYPLNIFNKPLLFKAKDDSVFFAESILKIKNLDSSHVRLCDSPKTSYFIESIDIFEKIILHPSNKSRFEAMGIKTIQVCMNFLCQVVCLNNKNKKIDLK